MDLKSKLSQGRKESNLSQEQVARYLDVTREVVSQWELGTRAPGVKALEQLASLYNAPYLINAEANQDTRADDRATLIEKLDCDEDVLNKEVLQWLEFLDRWGSYKRNAGSAPGRSKPHKSLDRGMPLKDSRFAAKEALAVREHYKLGREAIPNLYALLDDWNVLVYKANLGKWQAGKKEGISGAFYNHPDLGYCIIVNAQTTPGRQTFTLAHELAHAIYHYSFRTLVSRAGIKDPLETFADSFAGHFLIPTKTLNSLIEEYGWKNLDPYKVIFLASFFNVSWLFLLYRLHNEKHITTDDLRTWLALSPRKLAEAMGIDTSLFTAEVRGIENDLHRFPPSVLSEVRDALACSRLDRYQAAELLGPNVDPDNLFRSLCEPSPAEPDEVEARIEFDAPYLFAGVSK